MFSLHCSVARVSVVVAVTQIVSISTVAVFKSAWLPPLPDPPQELYLPPQTPRVWILPDPYDKPSPQSRPITGVRIHHHGMKSWHHGTRLCRPVSSCLEQDPSRVSNSLRKMPNHRLKGRENSLVSIKPQADHQSS